MSVAIFFPVAFIGGAPIFLAVAIGFFVFTSPAFLAYVFLLKFTGLAAAGDLAIA